MLIHQFLSPLLKLGCSFLSTLLFIRSLLLWVLAWHRSLSVMPYVMYWDQNSTQVLLGELRGSIGSNFRNMWDLMLWDLKIAVWTSNSFTSHIQQKENALLFVPTGLTNRNHSWYKHWMGKHNSGSCFSVSLAIQHFTPGKLQVTRSCNGKCCSSIPFTVLAKVEKRQRFLKYSSFISFLYAPPQL